MRHLKALKIMALCKRIDREVQVTRAKYFAYETFSVLSFYVICTIFPFLHLVYFMNYLKVLAFYYSVHFLL